MKVSEMTGNEKQSMKKEEACIKMRKWKLKRNKKKKNMWSKLMKIWENKATNQLKKSLEN